MNYIRHLNNVLMTLSRDERITPTHFTLYLALFQVWNENRFQNPISIFRAEVIRASKISSFSTYTRNLRQLQEWGYIEYLPSHNPALGTRVNLYDFSNTDCNSECNTSVTPAVTLNVQPPYINIYKDNKE
ncbi:MAG: hypothetical protein K2Q22_00905, partial [Cytophagales bacterium]|nr:hypothetical protein [Cytophagales bacterium]